MRATRRAFAYLWTTLLLTMTLSACGHAAADANTGHASAPPSPTMSATATATPLPPLPLQWKKLAAPTIPPAYSGFGGAALSVAPGNGDIAYLCAAPTEGIKDGQPHVWHTSDRGAHWIQGEDIPITRDENRCEIVVDMTHPATAIAVLQWMAHGAGGGPSLQDSLCFVTTDMGMTWRQLATSLPFIVTALGSSGGTTYAVRQVLVGNGAQSRLWASTDDMHTWRRVDMDITDEVADVWVAPGTAPILVESATGDGPRRLWQSRDGGQHWSEIAAPAPARLASAASLPSALAAVPMSSHLPARARSSGWGTKDEYVVQASSDGASWTICQSYYDLSDAKGAPNTLQCSTDGGRTWSVRAGPNMIHTQNVVARAEVIGIAHDGAVLAIEYDDATYGSLVYQLPEGATSWRSRGPATGFPIYYSPAPGGDILWVSGPAGTFVARY